MANVTVAVLIGLPGCGKSTCARALCGGTSDVGAVSTACYSFDVYEAAALQDARTQMTGSKASAGDASAFDPAIWREARERVYNEVEARIRGHMEKSTSKHLVVLLDDNFYLRSMRKRFFQLARTHRAEYKQVSFEAVASLATCRERVAARNKIVADPDATADGGNGVFVPEFSLEAMAAGIEYPQEEPLSGTHAWENSVSTCVLHDAAGSAELATQLREFLFPGGRAYSEAVPAACTDDPSMTDKSVQPDIHHLDNRLKKLVGAALQTVSGPQKQVLAKRFGLLKKETVALADRDLRELAKDDAALAARFDQICDEFLRACASMIQGR